MEWTKGLEGLVLLPVLIAVKTLLSISVLLANALQALGGPGLIQIAARGETGQVVVVFRDSGPGFPPEAIAKALDPFFTTKDNGTGLGLPIVNTIVSSHGGSLALDNHPDGGALITVTLPRLHEDFNER